MYISTVCEKRIWNRQWIYLWCKSHIFYPIILKICQVSKRLSKNWRFLIFNSSRFLGNFGFSFYILYTVLIFRPSDKNFVVEHKKFFEFSKEFYIQKSSFYAQPQNFVWGLEYQNREIISGYIINVRKNPLDFWCSTGFFSKLSLF